MRAKKCHFTRLLSSQIREMNKIINMVCFSKWTRFFIGIGQISLLPGTLRTCMGIHCLVAPTTLLASTQKSIKRKKSFGVAGFVGVLRKRGDDGGGGGAPWSSLSPAAVMARRIQPQLPARDCQRGLRAGWCTALPPRRISICFLPRNY
jgi:hypothetical protein